MPAVDAPPAFRRQLLDAIPRLRRYARSLVFDSHGADDLVQTTLERALAHWHQFDQRRDIVLWAVSIAHNAFMDDRRREKRQPASDSYESYDERADQLPAPGVDIGLRIDLIAALRQLPLEQREPLLLVSLEQLSYADCAESLGIPIGTVMSRVSRGRAALRELLEGKPPRSAGGLRRVV
jgi:RNA polymerase sigma-70 factor (ECF subfamily)